MKYLLISFLVVSILLILNIFFLTLPNTFIKVDCDIKTAITSNYTSKISDCLCVNTCNDVSCSLLLNQNKTGICCGNNCCDMLDCENTKILLCNTKYCTKYILIVSLFFKNNFVKNITYYCNSENTCDIDYCFIYLQTKYNGTFECFYRPSDSYIDSKKGNANFSYAVSIISIVLFVIILFTIFLRILVLKHILNIKMNDNYYTSL